MYYSIDKRFFHVICLAFIFTGVLFAEIVIDKHDVHSTLEYVKRQEMQAWAEGILWAQHRDDMRQEQFDSRFVNIDLKVFFSTYSIEATVQTTFESQVNGLTQIKLDFDDQLMIDSVFGDVISYTMVGETLTIDLDRPYQIGEVFTTATAYHGQPRVIGGLKGFRFVNHSGVPNVATLCTPFLAHYWWPCVDGPADKLDSVHLFITIPDTSYGGYPMYAASNGKLVDTTHTGNGWITYAWQENYPIVPYYVSVAITNYRIFSHYYPYGTDSMEVPYYVFPEHYSSAQQTFAETVDMITFFANLYGEYPFINEKYSMADIGFYGAIENQTKTIMGGVTPSWYMVVCHELSHMWFGDMISPTSWHHVWINEGFATYSEALWWGDKYGMTEYHAYIEDLEYWGDGTIYLEDVSNPWGVFLTIVYNKGAWVLHMLRHVVGDSIFFEILHDYATDPQFMYKNADTEDFQQICENISGMNLASFFDQWIYDEYYPQYEYWWSSSQKADQKDQYQVQAGIRQKQQALGWRPVFEMPIDLQFEMPGSDTTVVVQNHDTVQIYQFNLNEQPTALNFDPENWILDVANEIGVEERIVSVNNQAAIFPTVFSGLLCLPDHGSYRIYDITGREVKITHLAPGIYFIKIDNRIVTKVIKVK
jgi:aminopeptidase N